MTFLLSAHAFARRNTDSVLAIDLCRRRVTRSSTRLRKLIQFLRQPRIVVSSPHPQSPRSIVDYYAIRLFVFQTSSDSSDIIAQSIARRSAHGALRVTKREREKKIKASLRWREAYARVLHELCILLNTRGMESRSLDPILSDSRYTIYFVDRRGCRGILTEEITRR